MVKYLVSGDNQLIMKLVKNDDTTDHFYCSVARSLDVMCGMEGKYYIPFDPPFSPVSPVSPETPATEYSSNYEYIPPVVDNSDN